MKLKKNPREFTKSGMQSAEFYENMRDTNLK